MRTLWLLPCLTFSLIAQDSIQVQAPIARVRLHPDEAWVTRVGRVRVESAGTHRLVVKNLPQGLQLDDVRVNAKGPAGSRLGDLGLSSEVRKVTESAEYKALLKEREGLRDRHDALEAEGESIPQELKFLSELQATHDKELSSRMTYTAPNSTAIIALGRDVQTRSLDLMIRERKRKRLLEKLQEEEARLDAEIQKRASEQLSAPSQASIELTTSAGGEIELELSIRTRAARWIPTYEARLSADRKQLELVLSAAITQRSGEDWENAKLEISNVRASRSLDLPRYDRAQEVAWEKEHERLRDAKRMNEVAQPAPAVVSQNVYRSGANRPSAPTVEGVVAASTIDEAQATVLEEAQGLGVTFVLDGFKNVPSDGEPHRFRVTSREINPELHLVAAPRLDPTVYQVARFATPSGFPIFPHASITQFAGTQRLGQTQIQIPSPGQPFELGFGPYRSVRVSFTRVDVKKEQSGTFTKERLWTLRERFDVSNDGGETQEVEIQDRALKSTVEQVKITNTSDTTPSTERQPGVRTWTFSVKSKANASLLLGTLIRAPQDGFLSGLEGLRLP
jgi:uncharacterized protein (TIGR02231 family)